MKKSTIFLLLLSAFWSVKAQSLSPSAKVSLITFGPGEEMYSAFGHTGIWVYDPSTGVDKVYNYGTFDFQTDGFYWKFARGTLPYQLSYASFEANLSHYQRTNRSVLESELALSGTQKQRLYDLLEENYLPQNREYFYKPYHDNCATRPGLMIEKACSDSLEWGNVPSLKDQSLRNWMNQYLTKSGWIKIGLNMLLGDPIDEVVGEKGSFYIPDNLRVGVEKATLGGQPLVVRTRLWYETVPSSEGLPQPLFAFGLLFLLIVTLTFRQYRNQSTDRQVDSIIFSILGILGWIMIFLWWGTNHGITENNPSLLWAMPLHLPLFYLSKGKNWESYYWGFTLILLLLAMVICQGVWPELLPVWALIGLRAGFRCYVSWRIQST
jgi:Domain of unknown function (DUF4105)